MIEIERIILLAFLLVLMVSPVLASSYDLNGDGIVDMKDLGIVGRAFGTEPGDDRWNPDADLNNDLVVDTKDVGIVARHFGEEI